MSEALTMDPSGRHELTAEGYTVRIDRGRIEDSDRESITWTPPAAHIEFTDGDENFMVMVGRSPVDGQMVIHIDACADLPLARLYLNDTLIHGTESERTL